MPRIICFTAPKGGCGSTFVCSSLALSLSQSGMSVLALDMCFEKGTLDFALGFQNDYVYTLSDVSDGTCSLCECAVTQGQLSFVRAGYEKNNADINAIGDILKSSEYDYVLIDILSIGSDECDFVSDFADKLVIVTDPTHASCKICDIYLSEIDFSDISIVVNKIIPSYVKNNIQMTVDEVLDTLGIPLLGLVPWCPIAYAENTEFKDNYLNTAFSNIALRLGGDRVPAMEISKVYDCFKLSRNLTKGRK